MIRRVSANQPTFRTVNLRPGFNVILADRTETSTSKDSRNGLGKSTLVDIIKFCLGSYRATGQGIIREELEGWSFTLELDVLGEPVSITRTINDHSHVTLQGRPALSQFVAGGEWDGDAVTVAVDRASDIFGRLLFGLTAEGKYAPTFRSLMSYFLRRGEGFGTPFEHHRKQAEWDKQVHNAYLLGLNWELCREWQLLKDRLKSLKQLKKAAEEGQLESFIGTAGELEAAKVQWETRVAADRAALDGFRIHPQYEELESQVNGITMEMHDEANRHFLDMHRLRLYTESVRSEEPPDILALERLYSDAGVSLPGVTLRRLEDAASFHDRVIEHRRAFLSSEIMRLQIETDTQRSHIEVLDNERSRLMELLDGHGALTEFRVLQEQSSTHMARLRDIEANLGRVQEIKAGEDEISVQLALLQQRARLDFEERRHQRERAISLFGANTEALYAVPGSLIIDVGRGGYRFAVEIERADSEGISKMKVFSYDLMIAELWSDHDVTPGFLVHDSALFDGVDERQVALALQLAKTRVDSAGFQYICMLNTDDVPEAELSKIGLDLSPYTRLTLTDESESGMLLGMKF